MALFMLYKKTNNNEWSLLNIRSKASDRYLESQLIGFKLSIEMACFKLTCIKVLSSNGVNWPRYLSMKLSSSLYSTIFKGKYKKT